MMMTKLSIEEFLNTVESKNPDQPEFIQAVEEVSKVLIPFINTHPIYLEHKILQRMVEPERIVQFKVVWHDDENKIHINRGYRVQMNSSIGPYKGGLRFHPTVNLGILKFLAFEQVFKNSLTTLPLGGGKGGSDFDPKGKSDMEIMRFCKAFMEVLYPFVGQDKDVPAGDIGVGGREIGYLYGAYKRIRHKVTDSFTGKGLQYGGSLIRPEATGYGLLYFVKYMLKGKNESLSDKNVVISGSGNVALYAAQKCLEMGAKVLTLSDSSGFIYDAQGITKEKLDKVFHLKLEQKKRVSAYLEFYPDAVFVPNETPWSIKCDIALPCATQNELDLEDAEKLYANGCQLVAEGANMPCTPEAVGFFTDHGILYAPGKAANAGGVAVSGLEMSQNAMGLCWDRREVDERLKHIMKEIHQHCSEYGKDEQTHHIDYLKGANIAGFVKVADAMIAQGF